jgi:hypothetical protein
MGGQPKSLYQNLPPSQDYEVVTIESVMGKWTTVVAPFLAGWGGVLWVRNCDCLLRMFELLVEQTMAAIYVFDAGRLDIMMQIAKERFSELQVAVESDPQHFIYIVDEDAATSSDDVVEIIKWGPQCQSTLTQLVENDDL